MLLYEDPTYLLCIHLQAPLRNAILTPAMQAFNSSMSAVRESVEWFLGDIANYFKFMDFHKNLKIVLISVGKMYVVSALFCNAHTILIWSSQPLKSILFMIHLVPIFLLISTIFFAWYQKESLITWLQSVKREKQMLTTLYHLNTIFICLSLTGLL